jgi:hypothetical protein
MNLLLLFQHTLFCATQGADAGFTSLAHSHRQSTLLGCVTLQSGDDHLDLIRSESGLAEFKLLSLGADVMCTYCLGTGVTFGS